MTNQTQPKSTLERVMEHPNQIPPGTTVIAGKQFEAFPPEKIRQLEEAANRRMQMEAKATGHFPIKSAEHKRRIIEAGLQVNSPEANALDPALDAQRPLAIPGAPVINGRIPSVQMIDPNAPIPAQNPTQAHANAPVTANDLAAFSGFLEKQAASNANTRTVSVKELAALTSQKPVPQVAIPSVHRVDIPAYPSDTVKPFTTVGYGDTSRIIQQRQDAIEAKRQALLSELQALENEKQRVANEHVSLPTSPEHPAQNLIMSGEGVTTEAVHSPEAAHYSQIPETSELVEPARVANPVPPIGRPVADHSAMSLDLPSRFAFYRFKDLYAKPLTLAALQKLESANRSGSTLAIAEVVSSVCYTTGQTTHPVGFELTWPDFMFVLYWLRSNSFVKAPYTHRSVCTNEDHLQRVELYSKLDQYKEMVTQGSISQEQYQQVMALALKPETLQNTQVIRDTDVQVNYLETAPDVNDYPLYALPGMTVCVPTIIDHIDVQELLTSTDDEQIKALTFYLELAGCFNDPTRSMRIAQRMDMLTTALKPGEPLDDVITLKRFGMESMGYGVTETFQVNCRHCGHTYRTRLNIRPSDFFQ